MPDTTIPASYQLCTDGCGRVRALVDGITGCASLCQPCFQARTDAAKLKTRKKPKRMSRKTQVHGYTDEEWNDLLDEAMNEPDPELPDLEEL